ncbi:MAG: YkgJ family cysteine cluster protein [Fibrobacteraceae bacterium]|nr:YkgJ family cysteine cluster protein [Fibrobacteraceae bacterium]
MASKSAFKCDCCGLCCRQLKRVPQLSAFDRGDGVCINLNKQNRCNVYTNRPEICNTELMYQRYFASKMTREEYDLLNMQICQELKSCNKMDKSFKR